MVAEMTPAFIPLNAKPQQNTKSRTIDMPTMATLALSNGIDTNACVDSFNIGVNTLSIVMVTDAIPD